MRSIVAFYIGALDITLSAEDELIRQMSVVTRFLKNIPNKKYNIKYSKNMHAVCARIKMVVHINLLWSSF